MLNLVIATTGTILQLLTVVGYAQGRGIGATGGTAATLDFHSTRFVNQAIPLKERPSIGITQRIINGSRQTILFESKVFQFF